MFTQIFDTTIIEVNGQEQLVSKEIAVTEFQINIAKRNLEIWNMYNEGYAPSFIAQQYRLAGIARILTHMRKVFNVVA